MAKLQVQGQESGLESGWEGPAVSRNIQGFPQPPTLQTLPREMPFRQPQAPMLAHTHSP